MLNILDFLLVAEVGIAATGISTRSSGFLTQKLRDRHILLCAAGLCHWVLYAFLYIASLLELPGFHGKVSCILSADHEVYCATK